MERAKYPDVVVARPAPLTECLVPKQRLPSKQARPREYRAKAEVVSVDSC